MEAYLANGLFRTYENSFVYVERTLQNGSVRKGLVGMVDLEAYDYNPGSTSAVRATERTVTERIPPASGSGGTPAWSCPIFCCCVTTTGRCCWSPSGPRRRA